MTDEANKVGNNADTRQTGPVEYVGKPGGTSVAYSDGSRPSDEKNGVSGDNEAVTTHRFYGPPRSVTLALGPDRYHRVVFDQPSLDAMAAETMGGHANTEAEAMASFEHQNCPTCGGSGHVDDVERFDITKPRDLRQDALLAIDVLNGPTTGLPFAPGDGRKIAGVVRALIAKVDTLAVGDVAALTIKLADAEERLAKYEGPDAAPIAGVDEMAKALRGSAFSREQLNTAANLLERLRGAIRHDREHAGKLEARVRVLTAERDSARELADQADGYLQRAESFRQAIVDNAGVLSTVAAERDAATAARDMMQGKLADMTTNRDALDEICQRKDEHIRTIEIERDTARDIAALFRETLVDVRGRVMQHDLAYTASVIDNVLSTVPPERPRNAVESAAYLALGTWLAWPDAARVGPLEVNEGQVLSWLSGLPNALADAKRTNNSRPRCRVVTSPRFYGEDDRISAARAFHDDALGASDHEFGMESPLDRTSDWCFEVVDCVATALGMRRAPK